MSWLVCCHMTSHDIIDAAIAARLFESFQYIRVASKLGIILHFYLISVPLSSHRVIQTNTVLLKLVAILNPVLIGMYTFNSNPYVPSNIMLHLVCKA